jgi:hypothetical protein
MDLGNNLGNLGDLDLGQMQQFLQGVNFPAQKEEEVASNAEGNGAPQGLVEQIRGAATERFNGPEEVLRAVRGS